MDSKAVSWNESLKISDFQFNKYLVQQCCSEFMSQRRIFMPIYKYKIEGPWKLFDSYKENRLENIVKELSNKTAFMLLLPFSLAFKIHNQEINKKFTSRYDGEFYDNMTRFSSRGIKLIIEGTAEAFEEIGINMDDYSVEKLKLPEGMKMNQFGIKPFPIALVSDKNYNSWLERFKEENAEKVSQLLHEKKTRDDYRNGLEKEIRDEGCSDKDEESNLELEWDEEKLPF